MTEKRFTIKEFSTLDAMSSLDVICDNGIELPSSTACDLLNKLHEENEELKEVFRVLITSGYWDDDYLTEQDWNDLKRYIENVFEKVMKND